MDIFSEILLIFSKLHERNVNEENYAAPNNHVVNVLKINLSEIIDILKDFLGLEIYEGIDDQENYVAPISQISRTFNVNILRHVDSWIFSK